MRGGVRKIAGELKMRKEEMEGSKWSNKMRRKKGKGKDEKKGEEAMSPRPSVASQSSTDESSPGSTPRQLTRVLSGGLGASELGS